MISEGSAVVVVESLEHAMARGARVYLEITGYSAQMDHDPNDPFVGLENAMRLAMANASRQPHEIDYICSYGPGHPNLDAAEVKMIRRVFGPLAERVPVSSIKGVTGEPTLRRRTLSTGRVRARFSASTDSADGEPRKSLTRLRFGFCAWKGPKSATGMRVDQCTWIGRRK